MEKKKIVTIVASIGAVILVAAAAIIFIGIFADRQPGPAEPTQPPFSSDDWQPESYADPPTLALTTSAPVTAPESDITGLAEITINPSAATATIKLTNGSTITGNRHVENNTTFFTFYTDGSTVTIRLKVPDNMVLVCTDDAVIEQMDARGKSFIQSRQTNPAEYFTKAYSGAVVSLANHPNGKVDVWCAAD
ncbi:MAG: hypothetical protein FWH26_00010 [Oscillospiraceae bacterium]|nr:hypothetical protein [Oscillospiraceae bacterium]